MAGIVRVCSVLAFFRLLIRLHLVERRDDLGKSSDEHA